LANEKGLSGRITVRVNGAPVEIFRGMKVRHALIALDQELLRKAERGAIRIEDGRGYEVGLDGALQDGSELFLKQD
jgi:hypothetical protein